MSRERLNLKGKVFGRLTVLEYAGNNKQGRAMWKCGCRCGWYSVTDSSTLVREKTNARSCGHCHAELRWPAEYSAWESVKARCSSDDPEMVIYYKNKGITVCQRWREDFFNFLEDMGLKEFSDLSLDRIDGSGNYEPNNCRWASKRTQSLNRSNST